MTGQRDPDLPPRPGEAAAEPPADLSDELMVLDIRNGDLTSSRRDPAALAPTSDPDPAATDADFGGHPLTDAEVDALPVEEA